MVECYFKNKLCVQGENRDVQTQFSDQHGYICTVLYVTMKCTYLAQ